MITFPQLVWKFLNGKGAIIALVPVLAVLLRLSMTQPLNWIDAAAVLAVFLNWPQIEYLAHKYMMHRWPFSLFYATHNRHHNNPTPLTGLPDWWIVICYPPLTFLWFFIGAAHMMTINAAVFVMLFLYEFVHYSCHENYKPLTRWGWRVRVNHLMHHNLDETERFAMLFPGVFEDTRKK